MYTTETTKPHSTPRSMSQIMTTRESRHANCMSTSDESCDLHAMCLPIHGEGRNTPTSTSLKPTRSLATYTKYSTTEVTCLVSTGFRGGRCLFQGHLELNGLASRPRVHVACMRRACDLQTMCTRFACVRNTRDLHVDDLNLGILLNTCAQNQAALDVLNMP